MHLRIQYVLPLFLLFACDKTERDWSKCNDAAPCAQGYTCGPDFRCVLAVDGAAAEVPAPPVDAGGREVAEPDTVEAPVDVAVGVAADVAADAVADLELTVDVAADLELTVDVAADLDVAIDVAVELDVAVDMAVVVADAVADVSVDTRPVDSEGSCGSDDDCDASAPLCLAFRCAKCKTSNDCASRADSGVGGGVCDTTSGKCVACAKSSADPTKPVCVSNLCVACSSAANECRVKSSAAPVCDSTTGKCVACLANADCTSSADGGVDGGADGGAAAGFCNTTTNQCVGCLEHDDCSDPNKPICGSSQTCVGCGSPGVSAGTCATKKPALPVCKPDAGACVECTGNADCRGDAGLRVCNPATNRCVECDGNADCTADSAKGFCVNNTCTGCQTAGAGTCTGAKPVCATSGSYLGQCVECAGNTDCKVATKPVCDTNQCRGCAKDLECTGISPAVVCGLDGSCPGDSAVIYLQNSASCSTADRGDGSAATPFCYADDAAAALLASATKLVIVVHGTVAPLGPLALALSTPPRLIAGKSSATMRPPPGGAPPVIAITAGDVTLRDLTISNGNDTGVSVSSGATLRMDRCYVLSNQGIGIQATASAFDIVNTVVAGNGAGAGGYGVSLGNYNGSPSRFAFNTVVNNVGGGVFCGTPSNYALKGILANGNGPTNFLNCVTDPTTSTASPNLDASYHLTSSSFCRDHGGATCPPDDIDGDTRPIGTACDCGADEYKP
jgi:hypothetical protein